MLSRLFYSRIAYIVTLLLAVVSLFLIARSIRALSLYAAPPDGPPVQVAWALPLLVVVIVATWQRFTAIGLRNKFVRLSLAVCSVIPVAGLGVILGGVLIPSGWMQPKNRAASSPIQQAPEGSVVHAQANVLTQQEKEEIQELVRRLSAYFPPKEV